jgi:drug/metabolite transporter (DMT)-like permease
MLNERTNIPYKMVGYVVGFIGILILMSNFQISTMFAEEYLLGDFLLVSAGAIWSFHSVLGKKIFRSEPSITNIELKYNMLTMILACIPVFFLLINLPEYQSFLQYPPSIWLYICFMGLISTGFGLFLFFIGLRKIEVSKGISLALLKPIIVTILAFLILDEIPTIALIVSIGFVTSAVLLINRPTPKR